MGCKHHCRGIALRTTLLDTGQGVVRGGRGGIDRKAASPLGFVPQDHPKQYIVVDGRMQECMVGWWYDYISQSLSILDVQRAIYTTDSYLNLDCTRVVN
jgi:hypothetical protein